MTGETPVVDGNLNPEDLNPEIVDANGDTATDNVEASAENTPEAGTEAPPAAPAPSKVTVKDALEVTREPSPASKKGKVFAYGRSEEGGSFTAIATEFGCTLSNVRQHVAQCHANLGFGYKIEGDKFWITGEITESWDAQVKIKEAKAEEKKAEVAAKAAEVKAEKEAAAKKYAEEHPEEAAAAAAAGAPAEGSTAEELPDTPQEEDDFLE